MLKEKCLLPIFNFLKKFGEVNFQELKRQAKRNSIDVKVGDYRFIFIFKNGWRLIAIS